MLSTSAPSLADSQRAREEQRRARIEAVQLTPAETPAPEENRQYADRDGVILTLPALTQGAFYAFAQAIDAEIMPRYHCQGWIPEDRVWKLRALLMLERLTEAERREKGMSVEDWRAGLDYRLRPREDHRRHPTPAATLRAFCALRYVCCTDGSQELDCQELRCEARIQALANGGRPRPPRPPGRSFDAILAARQERQA